MHRPNYYINTINKLYEYILDELRIPAPSGDIFKISKFLLDPNDYPDYKSIEKYIVGTQYYLYIKKLESQTENNYLLLNAISDAFINILCGPSSLGFDHFCDETGKRKLLTEIKKYVDGVINDKLFSLSDLFIELSNTKYEKRVCKGHIVVDKSEHNSYAALLSESQEIDFCLGNKRMIRKMLEITSDNVALLVEKKGSKYVASKFIDISDCREKCQTIIDFCGYRHFQVFKQGKLFIEYKIDSFKIESQNEISPKDKTKIINFFDDNLNCSICLSNLINRIKSMGDDFHGALLVFTNDSSFEERMFSFHRSTRVYECENLNIFRCFSDDSSFIPEKEFIAKLSCVDGAIIFNINGDILSFGTILDGRAKCNGRQDRGSRYNSTLTFVSDYYKSQKKKGKKYLGIVISEDGNIDVLDGQNRNK